jgi:hypothetical protein
MEASSSKATVAEATVEATDLSTTGQPLALVYMLFLAFSSCFLENPMAPGLVLHLSSFVPPIWCRSVRRMFAFIVSVHDCSPAHWLYPSDGCNVAVLTYDRCCVDNAISWYHSNEHDPQGNLVAWSLMWMS